MTQVSSRYKAYLRLMLAMPDNMWATAANRWLPLYLVGLGLT
jgi:hypothetical protein